MRKISNEKTLSPIILTITATIPLIYGAVQPFVWPYYAVAMVLFLGWALWPKETGGKFTRIHAAVGIFFGYALFLVCPLPLSWIQHLSSKRFEAAASGDQILNAVHWHSQAYMPLQGFMWLLLLFSFVLFFVIFRQEIKKTSFLRRLLWLLLVVGLLEALYGILQVLVPKAGVLLSNGIGANGNARGTFINRNHFAGLIEMIWPLALGMLLSTKGFRGTHFQHLSAIRQWKLALSSDHFGPRLFFAFALVLSMLALLFSRSRAGITGGIIGFITFMILLKVGGRKQSAGAWVGTVLGAALLITYSAVIGIDTIIERFLQLANGVSRLDIWRDSFRIVLDHPLGIGLKNFEYVFPVYNTFGTDDVRFFYAHNDYLQLLVETGWPGFALIVGGFLWFLARSIKKVAEMKGNRHSVSDFHFYIGIGALSGLISIAFHSFFDFNLQIPSNLLYFLILIALVHRCLWQPANINRQAHAD